MNNIPLGWKESILDNTSLWLGRFCLGHTARGRQSKHAKKPWYAWIYTGNETGVSLGWFATEAEARTALEAGVRAALREEPAIEPSDISPATFPIKYGEDVTE